MRLSHGGATPGGGTANLRPSALSVPFLALPPPSAMFTRIAHTLTRRAPPPCARGLSTSSILTAKPLSRLPARRPCSTRAPRNGLAAASPNGTLTTFWRCLAARSARTSRSSEVLEGRRPVAVGRRAHEGETGWGAGAYVGGGCCVLTRRQRGELVGEENGAACVRVGSVFMRWALVGLERGRIQGRVLSGVTFWKGTNNVFPRLPHAQK